MFPGEDRLEIVVYKHAVAQHLVETGCSTLVFVKTDAVRENLTNGALNTIRISSMHVAITISKEGEQIHPQASASCPSREVSYAHEHTCISSNLLLD